MRPVPFNGFCLLIASVCSIGIINVAAAADDDSFEADQAYIREHYTKYEYQIPMRDGVKLFTSAFVPKDASEAYPILLQRTPYGIRPYGESNYPEKPGGQLKYFAKEKFIFAYQDVRGRNGSEGEFVHVRPQRPHNNPPTSMKARTRTTRLTGSSSTCRCNNGNVGLLGISYPGFYAAVGMIDAHPALKCSSPQAPVSEWFIGDDFRHNGAIYLAHAFGFLSRFGQPLTKPTRQNQVPFDFGTPDGYEFYLNLGPLDQVEQKYFDNKIIFWNELLEHSTYDEFWKDRTILPHLKNIKPAVMTVGGWYDAEDLYGALHVYQFTERQSPGASNMLVMGPWAHGDWHGERGDHLGQISFHQPTSEYFRNEIELPFLKHWLKGAEDPQLPEAYVFETGANQWRKYDSWPPKNTEKETLYLHPRGRLSFDTPTDADQDSFDEYVSDPNRPVPFTPDISIRMTREHMVDDQRFASRRPDVLVFVSDPLTEDLTIAGPISPRLFVSTTGTDADWVVKLIDVYSGDYSSAQPDSPGRCPPIRPLTRWPDISNWCAEKRCGANFETAFEMPKPFVPGEIAKIEYVMPDAYHTFRRGHKIMIQIQSSWFPLIDRNPQKFMEIIHARPDDFQKATQRVYHSPSAGSQVQIRVLKP